MTVKDLDFDYLVNLAHRFGRDEALDKMREMGRYSEEELEELKTEYLRLANSAQNGYPPKIIAIPGREPWYTGPLPGDRYWPALKRNLEKSGGIPPDQLDHLDAATTKIVAYTNKPSEQRWDTRGLVVGYVQSGKTTNFTSVIAKAVDAGYNLVIVLSGIHNGLRTQTQERLEGQLCELHPDGWVKMTQSVRDFRDPPQTLESLLPKGTDRKAVLLVVKKNTAVLTKVVKWLHEAKGGIRNVRALIIDDESDQATVATAKINPLIRKMLAELPRHTLIGYTATPFANVLIDPSVPDELYPKDFILNLPRPDRYFGTEMIFGRDDPEDGSGPVDGYDMVRIVPDEEAANLRPAPKPRKKKGEDPPPPPPPFEPEVTPSLRKATLWFWLASAARRARGDRGHSTMLVHTSMKTDVHEAFRDPLIELRDEIRRALAVGDIAVEHEFDELWRVETSRVSAAEFEGLDLTTPAYADVREHLSAVLDATKIVLDNSRSTERLDYRQGPQTAIAIGGNTLSRGLTLEGLVVSFFIRSAKAYDTLLQMGRWFGFRIGYEDLPRIYMTKELRGWFRHLAMVEHEIRLDIERYEQQTLTPVDIGVRIRTHPTLLATQKLGAARQAYASYGGRRVQTRYFSSGDQSWLQENLLSARSLVAAATDAVGEPERRDDGSALWRGVPAHAVRTFLDRYEPHPDSPDLARGLVLGYIDEQLEKGSLARWSVAVMGAAGHENGTVDLAGHRFGRIVRARLADDDPDRSDIKTLMSKEHRVTDMDIAPAEARKLPEEKLVGLRNDDPELRDRGLVLLYPIDPKSEPGAKERTSRVALDAVEDVIGMALVFPGNKGDGYISVDLSKVDLSVVPALEDEDPDEVDALIEGDLDDLG